MPPGPLGDGYGEPFEEAGFRQDAHDDHHADEQEDDVHVDALDGDVVGHEVEQDDRAGPQQSGGGFVYDVKGDQGIDHEKDGEGEDHGETLKVENAVHHSDTVDNANEDAIADDENLGASVDTQLKDDFQHGRIFGNNHEIRGHDVARRGGLH